MKKINKNNFRVVIEPRRIGDYGFCRISDNAYSQEEKEKEYAKMCRDILDECKRHIDNVGSIYIDYDAEEICSFCGYGWDIDPETKEPLCCNKAIDEFNISKTLKPLTPKGSIPVIN